MVEKESRYSSIAISNRSPKSSVAKQIASNHAPNTHIQAIAPQIVSQTESFGTIPIEEKVPVEEAAEEALKSKEETKNQNTIVEEANLQYQNMLTEEVPVAIADS